MCLQFFSLKLTYWRRSNKTEKSFSPIGCAINDQSYRFTLKSDLWKDVKFFELNFLRIYVIGLSDSFSSFKSSNFCSWVWKIKKENKFLISPESFLNNFNPWLCAKLNWRQLADANGCFLLKITTTGDKTMMVLWGCAADAQPKNTSIKTNKNVHKLFFLQTGKYVKLSIQILNCIYQTCYYYLSTYYYLLNKPIRCLQSR